MAWNAWLNQIEAFPRGDGGFFPVVAEYADVLVQQGSFGQLDGCITSHLLNPPENFSKEEVRLRRSLSLSQTFIPEEHYYQRWKLLLKP